MSSTHSYRFRQRIAISRDETPDFLGIENAIYLTDGINGNIIYFEDGILKTKSKNGLTASMCGSQLIDSSGVYLGRWGSPPEGYNIAIGDNVLQESSALGDSIAIGSGVMGNCGKTELNIGIGKDTLQNINDNYNVGVGIEVMKDVRGPLANHNIGLGREALRSARDSLINIIAIGTSACSNMTGTNFQSVYIGDKAGQYLSSNILSLNNIGIGSQVFQEASNIIDMICIGSSCGKALSGIRGVIVGANAATDIRGSINEDVLVGPGAGSYWTYNDSKNVFVGSHAGCTGAGSMNTSIGPNSSNNLYGNFNTIIGPLAGFHLTGDSNIISGKEAGTDMFGSRNICFGIGAGRGITGSRNIIVGESSQIGDTLENSVLVGNEIFVKGTEAIVIGPSACKGSVGYLTRDILIGAGAGSGQKYGSIDHGKYILAIGSNAAAGDPDVIDSGDLVCLGHSAGQSLEQQFYRAVMIGNYAGSFAGRVHDSTVIGHSAGVGMSGSINIFMGPYAGFNTHGCRNIFIGDHIGYQAGSLNNDINNTMLIGHTTPTLMADLKNHNLVIGSPVVIQEWTDTKNTLGLIETKRPTIVKNVDGLLYATRNHLEYTTAKRSTVLTYPYKFVWNGDISSSFLIDCNHDGTTLIEIKIVPSDKLEYYFNDSILLSVKNGVASLFNVPVISTKWKFKVENSEFSIWCPVKGLLYIQAYGEHLLSKI